ncbi:MAG: coiled-coil domain-containing protein [Candidatus Microsaccharimonas sp.]
MKKLRTTTPASKSLTLKRGFLVFAAVIMAAASFFATQTPASADQYDDKIRALQSDMARYQAEANRLNGEATTLANALAKIANEKATLQAQVDKSQAEHDKLVIEIADTEKQIKENQDALGTTIADLYVDDGISPIEMLASSQNIGEFLDKQEYRNSVQDELSSTIKKVKDLKVQLTEKKEEVTKVLEEQKASRDAIVAKEAEQANLLARTQNDEAQYQGMIKDSEAQIAAARAAQARIWAQANATGGFNMVDSGSMPGYPWNNTNCWMVGYMSTGGAPGTDGEDGYGYGCRQCVSYAAWRIAKETGYYYSDLGNGGSVAYNLLTKHANHGYKNLGTNPEPGSIAVLWGTYSAPYSNAYNPGHVAWVEDVSGNQVLVSQYNYDWGAGYGHYSKMWLSKSFFNQYVKKY